MTLLLALLVQAQGEWPTYHGGFGLAGVADTAPPDAPARLWRYKTEGRIDVAPVAGDGRVYGASSKGLLFALDLAGKELWTARLEKDTFSSPPLHTDQTLVIGTSNGFLLAYHAATGKEKWKYEVGALVQATPNRVDLADRRKAVFAVSQADGSIHAVDLETGKVAWKTGAIERCDGSAGTADGRVAMGSCASAIHVFSIDKGEKTSDIALGEDSQVAGGVALVGKIAYAGTRSGRVVAVDLAAERILWTNADCKREAFTTPAVNDARLLFGSDDGKIYSLDRATGAKQWEFDSGGSPKSPVIAGERAVVASGGSLFLLELATGRKIWSARVCDELASPALIGGKVIVGGDDGTVTAYGKE